MRLELTERELNGIRPREKKRKQMIVMKAIWYSLALGWYGWFGFCGLRWFAADLSRFYGGEIPPEWEWLVELPFNWIWFGLSVLVVITIIVNYLDEAKKRIKPE
jgi:hypothetical protein